MITHTFAISYLLTMAASAATVSLTDSTILAIPDGDPNGLFYTQFSLNEPGESISNIEVDVTLSASPGSKASIGDLYLHISDGFFTVPLINRPGRSESLPFGFQDDITLDVTFQETGLNFHNYRASSDTAINLTGDFSPDGRSSNPQSVLDTDTPTQTFFFLTGASAENRTFTIFAADFVGGDTEHQIESVTLRVETILVPEPSTTLLTLLGMTAFLRRRCR